jgi:hypothetical protein
MSTQGTKRPLQEFDGTTQNEEDIVQIRKRVVEANNALRKSGLAWNAGDDAVDDGPTDEEDEEEEEEEEDDETDDDTEDDSVPPSPIAPDTGYGFSYLSRVVHTEKRTQKSLAFDDIFRHFGDAVRTASYQLHHCGYGEEEDDEMYFKGPNGLVELVKKSGNDSL